MGRFLSVDPVTASSINGGNFNRYWYGNNNPYKFTDPDGRQICKKSIGESCALPPRRPAHWGKGSSHDVQPSFGADAGGGSESKNSVADKKSLPELPQSYENFGHRWEKTIRSSSLAIVWKPIEEYEWTSPPDLNLIKSTLRKTMWAIVTSQVVPDIQTATQVGKAYQRQEVSYRHMVYWPKDGGGFAEQEAPNGYGTILISNPEMYDLREDVDRLQWRIDW